MTEPKAHGDDGDDGTEDTELAERLARLLAEWITPSTVIVCVGNEMRGDDGAGVAVGQRLVDDAHLPWPVFNTLTAPESFLMRIVGHKPESVVLVDALNFGAPAGSVELVEPGSITGQGPSTHGPAPVAFLRALALMHPCRRVVLGIQPERTELGAALSGAVAAAVDAIVRAFALVAKRG